MLAKEGIGQLARRTSGPGSVDPENVGDAALAECGQPYAGATADIDDALGLNEIDQDRHYNCGGVATAVTQRLEELSAVERRGR
jgi:hypothetical protein